MVPGWLCSFSRVQVGFSLFQVIFMFFYGSRSGFMILGLVLMIPGLVFMIPGEILSLLIVPGWFNFELSAVGAK